MILYGRNPVMEALRGRRAATVGEVWAVPGAAREPWLEGVAVRTASPEEIERRCGASAHQGLCARAGAYPYATADELLGGEEPLVVALDQVQDPQNLGSICRTAECAGAAGLAIPERRAAEITPAVCKASAGAVEHLPVARVRNLADFLIAAREAGCWCYGASLPDAATHVGVAETTPPTGHAARAPAPTPARLYARSEGARASGARASGGRASVGRAPGERASGGRAPIPYTAPDYRGGVVLVLGSEGRGLRPRVASACDELIALPVLGRVQSLGVSAAAAAVLYEILHNRIRGLDNAP